MTHPKTSPVIDYNNPELSVLPRIVQHQNLTFITDIQDGTVIGYKYFDFENVTSLSLELRGTWKGTLKLCLDENGTQTVGQMDLDAKLPCWTNISIPVQAENGIHALYVKFEGGGKLDFKQLAFNTKIE